MNRKSLGQLNSIAWSVRSQASLASAGRKAKRHRTAALQNLAEYPRAVKHAPAFGIRQSCAAFACQPLGHAVDRPSCPRRGLVLRLVVLAFVCFWKFGIAAAPAAMDEESPWPRVRSTNGNTVTLHLPQVERWTSNSFVARAVVEVKPAN